MLYAVNWFVVVSLVILWSLAAWAFHSIAAWTLANAGTLAGGAGSIEALQVPVWLAPWIPSEYASSLNWMISSLTPAIQTVLEWAPAMTGGLSIAVWTAWATGAVLLVVLGFLVTGLVAVLSRRMSASATSSSSLATAR
ncbi:MAG: hypothetical protein Q7U28_07890 [Aquabacterium sp.]|nr:hypothetical protein [Aquabacterium sp.]